MEQSIVLQLLQLFGCDYSLPDSDDGYNNYKTLALEQTTGDKYLIWLGSTNGFKPEDDLILTKANNRWYSLSNVRLGTNTIIYKMELLAKHPTPPDRKQT